MSPLLFDRSRLALLGGAVLGLAMGAWFANSHPLNRSGAADKGSAGTAQNRGAAMADQESSSSRVRAHQDAAPPLTKSPASDQAGAADSDAHHPLDLAVSSAPYSAFGSMGNPWVSRFQWSFVGSSVDWQSTDPDALRAALERSLAEEKALLATTPNFDQLVSGQPWADERFQCFAFLGSAMEAPLPTLFVLGGRDYFEQASPEASLVWWEGQLGPLTEAARTQALDVLRNYERERRRESTGAFKRLFERRIASQRLARPSCIGVVQNRVVVLDAARLPALSLLDAEYREVANSSWREVRAPSFSL